MTITMNHDGFVAEVVEEVHSDKASATPACINVGIDVGSTTVKVAVLDASSHEVLFERYVRHHAHQAETALNLLEEVTKLFPQCKRRAAVCGSGGTELAQAIGIPFVQEVVANSLAVRQRYGRARCAIELGGQDAKMIFFKLDEKTGRLNISDMRMNGSCAGGTGAFIDEISSLLNVSTEQFERLAACGKTVYDISGRCGVFAKTDIQPLLNQGVSKSDIALSAFHAIAKQTIGGLAQGLDIIPPVVFEGGPLTFNPTLVQVFADRLHLSNENIIVPDHPETVVAVGAALALDELFAHEDASFEIDHVREAIAEHARLQAQAAPSGRLFFETDEERARFMERHALACPPNHTLSDGDVVRVFLGIDSGSTTTKLVFIDEDGQLFDSYYGASKGDPLKVAREALIELRDKYAHQGVRLDVQGCATTGYGEMLFAEAFGADCHVVETVAHAQAALDSVSDATFVLDIGGQDMKALWLDDGVITNIVVNEACSSGCGSFLETFASSLGMSVEDIAEAAFRSDKPAILGSRCTVFMNSSIVSEQRNGKTPDDIMAGLCRSIIENVFTKVVRVPNLESLGEHIVVQGGTFLNDAVLRAFEQHVGREVTRAPYPGLMGALGAARIAKERAGDTTTFIGLDALDAFTYSQRANVICPFCSNHCNRTLVTFSNGAQFITGNRCTKGEVIGDPSDKAVLRQVQQRARAAAAVPDLYRDRETLLFASWPHRNLAPNNGITIGIPRVLSFWDTAPFWQTFFESLGFTVRFSHPSTRTMYERGLSAVTSDTVCFPAKLVHGHVRDLADAGVDRIFMPSITTVESENQSENSVSMCAVVKGYPLVLRNSDDPERRFDIPFDAPLFHWFSSRDRERQLAKFMQETFGIPDNLVREAISEGVCAEKSFREALEKRGREALDGLTEHGGFAVVLASRPYHNDFLVNHELSSLFTEQGIAVLTADALPGLNEIDLRGSRLDIVNNFHARMLASAVMVAQDERLEYAQIVSFGCGHDAYLSDEIIRLSKEAGGSAPLILKVDESDARGPLRIRVRSFVETIERRRRLENQADSADGTEIVSSDDAVENAISTSRELPDPYPVKYTKADRREKVVLIPNTSHAFCRLMTSVFRKQGIRAVPLELGREEAIRLGKKYVHNDICFPAQMVIGEALAALESGKYDGMDVAVGTGKYIGDCRLTHYGALLRKALDDAGYEHVPILTNDSDDDHNLHPGFKFSFGSSVRIPYALPMIDVLEELLRKMRPYELVPGAANQAFEDALDAVMDGLEQHGIRGALKGFEKAIDLMCEVPYDRSNPHPTVLIVGEYLLNFHPGANRNVEAYLERNGMEVIEARMTDVIRKTYFYQHEQTKEYHVDRPWQQKGLNIFAETMFEMSHNATDRIAVKHPLYEPTARLPELAAESDPVIPRTFDAGEGILIPGEILYHAKKGCRAFVILQPFGCLPNHVVGRGISKRLKEMYPDAQILPLDYDPDVSFANLENRLQMLIMNAHADQVAEQISNEIDDDNNHPGDNDTTGNEHDLSHCTKCPVVLKEDKLSSRVAAAALQDSSSAIETLRDAAGSDKHAAEDAKQAASEPKHSARTIAKHAVADAKQAASEATMRPLYRETAIGEE